jgi:hypothetical protein
VPKTQSPKKDTKTASSDTTLDDVLKDFKASWEYASSSWHARWRDNIALYNNQRVKRGYDGITDTFVPMAFSTVETLTSALFGTKPKYDFLPPHEKQDQNTDILNGLLDYYWDKDQWSLKNVNTGRTMLKLGTAVDYYCWDKDHPVKINVPIRDFFIDPTATSLEDARYMGRRYLTTVSDLKSFEVVDPATGEMKPKYTNLDKITAYKQGDNTDKQEKDMWYGSTMPNPEDDQVEVIERWTKDKCISIANRCAVIEDAENYYKAQGKAQGNEYAEGLMPFNDARDYVDESLFYAKGEIDFIADQQELLNDLTNQYVDAITYTLNPMFWLDPAYADNVGDVENLPGAVYPYQVNRVDLGTVSPDAFNERLNIKNEMRETTASNEIVKGAATEGGKTTATEINAQIAGAGQRIGLKVTQLENGYFHREARIVFAMVRLYVTEPMAVRIIGKDGARWEDFNPEDFKDGDYEPRVQLDITLQQKKQQQAADAKELLGAFLGDPDVNQQELKKLVLSRSFDLEPDEVEALINPLPSMGAPLPDLGMMPQPPEMPQPALHPAAAAFAPPAPQPTDVLPGVGLWT